MVGVPTSRGCTACRKQKKKCISEDQIPPCQRCKRLGIDCLELGQRRLKFQNENDKLTVLVRRKDEKDLTLCNSESSTKKSTTDSHSSLETPSPFEDAQELVLRNPLSSDVTRLRSGYIRIIDGSVDISVHLPWNYGPYLEQVPLFLGISNALDASAEALMANYSCLRRKISPARDDHTLKKYSKALRALRSALTSHTEATSTETLAAISMLMIFESMAGFGPKSVLAHAGGAAKVYKERGKVAPRNHFEAMLQLSLRGAITIQSLYLPTNYFTNEEWLALTESPIGAQSSEEQSFRCFGVYARLMHDANSLFRRINDIYRHSGELLFLKAESVALKERLTPHLESLRRRFWDLTRITTTRSGRLADANASFDTISWDLNTYHAHIGRSYAFALATQVLINSLLQAIGKRLRRRCELNVIPPSWQEDQILAVESADLAREVCQLAKTVDRHRPLGTIYMPGALRLASVGADGMAYDPIKTLDMENYSETIEFIKDLGICERSPHSLDMKEEERQELVETGWDSQMGNMTVLDEMSLLLASYDGDFQENTSVESIKMALVWMKRKFTFEDTEPGKDLASALDGE